MNSLYELESVRQEYRGRTALELDHLVLEPGHMLGVQGENGSGKSTLLRILAMLEDPVQGTVRFEGKPASFKSRCLRRKISLLTQEPYLLKRSVRANVEYGLKMRGMAPDERSEIADQAMAMVGLDPGEYAKRPWYALSGGEAQRTALASRLALRPGVLLLDEPFNNLDVDSIRLIQQAALTARKEWNAALVIVSHGRDWLEQACDRILTFKLGRLNGDHTPVH